MEAAEEEAGKLSPTATAAAIAVAESKAEESNLFGGLSTSSPPPLAAVAPADPPSPRANGNAKLIVEPLSPLPLPFRPPALPLSFPFPLSLEDPMSIAILLSMLILPPPLLLSAVTSPEEVFPASLAPVDDAPVVASDEDSEVNGQLLEEVELSVGTAGAERLLCCC